MATWVTITSGDTPLYDELTLDGRYKLIVWTGSPAADLDDGHEVCECYIPRTDREYPDEGLMLVGRHRLDTRDRDEARVMALRVATDAIADYVSRHGRRDA